MSEQGKLITIALLSLTAVLLLCTLVIVDRLPVNQAQASGPLDRQGDYLMLPGDVPGGQQQYVYIMDLAVQKVRAYAVDRANNRVDMKAGFDLAK